MTPKREQPKGKGKEKILSLLSDIPSLCCSSLEGCNAAADVQREEKNVGLGKPSSLKIFNAIQSRAEFGSHCFLRDSIMRSFSQGALYTPVLSLNFHTTEVAPLSCTSPSLEANTLLTV